MKLSILPRKSSKFYVCLCAVVLLMSCDKEEESISPNFNDNDHRVSLNTATNIANNFSLLNNQALIKEGNKNARLSANKKIDNVKAINSKDSEALLYVVNYKNRNGFAIISGDERIIPILAYGDTGSFNIDNLPDGAKFWLEFVKNKIEHTKGKNKKANTAVQKLWREYDDEVVTRSLPPDEPGCGPDINIHIPNYLYDVNGGLIRYGQGTGYKQYLPTGVFQTQNCSCGKQSVGCGPVAIAQVMSYYHSKPVDVNFGIMPSTLTASWSCGVETAGQQELAQFMARLYRDSEALVINFTCNAATTQGGVQKAFQRAGYSNSGTWIDTYDYRLYADVRQGSPVIFIGTKDTFDANNAHIWVASGFREQITHVPVGDGTCSGYGFTHFWMNWGWNGSANNWYAINNLDPDQNGDPYDTWIRVLVNIRQ